MLNKKAQSPPLMRFIPILLVVTTVLTVLLIILFTMSSISIEDKRLKTQLVENTILNKNCFSEQFATIEESKYNEENLKKCFGENLNRISFEMRIDSKNSLYYNKDFFNEKTNLCSIKDSNVMCTTLKYPIQYITQNKETQISILSIHIIVI